MGADMARRLKECGETVTALFDGDREAAQSLAEELGAETCTRLDEVTRLSDIIFTDVTDNETMRQREPWKRRRHVLATVDTDDKAMRQILAKQESPASPRNRVFINCAAVSEEVHRRIEAKAKAGAAFLEDCMASAITQQAWDGLCLMCGGEKRTFNRVKSILAEISSSLHYIGGSGSDAVGVDLINKWMDFGAAGLAERLGISEDQGHDLAEREPDAPPADDVNTSVDDSAGVELPEKLLPFVTRRSRAEGLLGTPEAALRLKVSHTTVRDWANRRTLLTWKTAGNRLRIPSAQILGPGRVVPDLAKVFDAIGDAGLAWAFLTQEWPFEDEVTKPLELLKAGRSEEVLNAAPGFGTTFT